MKEVKNGQRKKWASVRYPTFLSRNKMKVTGYLRDGFVCCKS
ncbi:hypothetical protein [Kroppenstedtia pulmonis]|nr:hypothetical protein [Kroppenstedtia pulmonis]